MNIKILCVDDEPHVLQGYERALRKKFEIQTAVGGAEGILAIEKAGDFAVIVTDMRMPGIDGIQFLRRAKELAPNSVRIVLTGIADQQTAVDAVNEVNIFRFLSKPCSPETLAEALKAGLEQHRLITSEKQLLEETLGSSLQVLIEMLAMVNSTAFRRATHVKRLVGNIANRLNVQNTWELEIAAMLSQIGCIAVPEEILLRTAAGAPLEKDDLRLYCSHPEVGRDLIARIPRMERVAEIIAHQNMRYNDYAQPEPINERAPLTIIGARILKAALDFDKLLDSGNTLHGAFRELSSRQGWYDPLILDTLKQLIDKTVEEFTTGRINVSRLQLGMILDEQIFSECHTLLIEKGLEITPALALRLQSFAFAGIIPDKIQVKIPAVTTRADADFFFREEKAARDFIMIPQFTE